MRRHEADFEERGIRGVAVSPAPGASCGAVCAMFHFPFTCLGDPGGEAYDAYGLERHGIGRIIGLRTVWRGFRAFIGGHRQARAIGDRLRLPGAFIVGPEGGILWASRGREASDHASAAALLSALDETGRS